MTNQYHATPYDISAMGFYFSTYEEYKEKAANHCNENGNLVEEYEIQFIDGDNCALFSALGIFQATLRLWFEAYENMDNDEAAKAIYLNDYTTYDIESIPDCLDDIILFEGTALEYTEQYIDDTALLDEMPENLRYYFDTEAFARDLVISGDINIIEINNTQYVVWGV